MKKHWGFIFFLYIFLLPGKNFGFNLTLYDEIGINEDTISLEKLGKISFTKGEILLQKISEISILDFPPKPLFLKSQDIQKILKIKYGLNPNIIGKGVRIYPLYTSILSQEVAEKIKSELHHVYPELPLDFINILFIHPLKLPKVPAGNLFYKIRIPGGRKDVTKYVRIEVHSNSKELINKSFPIRLLFQIPIWKSKKNLPAGSVLKERDFSMQLKSGLQEPLEFAKKTKTPWGKTLKKKLPPHQILYWNYLEK